MNNSKDFKWDDELVKEFMDKYNGISDWITGIDPRGDKMAEFKQSKVKELSLPEKTRIIGFTFSNSNDDGTWYTFGVDRGININKFNEIEKAILSVVNGKEGVEVNPCSATGIFTKEQNDYVNSLRDCDLRANLLHQVRLRDNMEADRNGFEKMYNNLCKKVDTIRRETWEAAREFTSGYKKCTCYQSMYPTLEDYLQSLPETTPQPTPTSLQEEKEWEILSYTADYVKGEDQIFHKPFDFVPEHILRMQGKIHSVKRLSDGEVFTVGDKVEYWGIDSKWHLDTIRSLEALTPVGYASKSLHVGFGECGYSPISDLRKRKPIPEQPTQPSTKEQTVTNNDDVACLSLNDICDYYDDWAMQGPGSFRSYVEEKLKQKLNQ